MDEKSLKRITIKLNSNIEKPLSGWQLQEFIANISKGYSKLDLINEIATLINKGVKTKNIIIMHNSYEINNSYAYLNKTDEFDLSKSEMVKRLYNLGKPISMSPNDKIQKIKILFELYEKIYSACARYKVPVLSKENLKKYISCEFNDSIIKIKEDLIGTTNEVKLFDDKKIERFQEDLDKYIKKARKEYDTYINDKNKFDIFEKLKNKALEDLENHEKEILLDLERKYYSIFYEKLRNLDRPIILIYHEESMKMTMVKKEYILNDVDSENFLDYKDFSHNSPFVVTIIAGVAMAAIAYIIYEGKKQEKFNEQIERENEEKEDEIKKMIFELAHSKDLNQVNEIKDDFERSRLYDLKNKTIISTGKVLRKKGVINNKAVIDLDDYRKTNDNKKHEHN